MAEFDPQKAIEDTNLLVGGCAASAARMIETLQRSYPPSVALTIAVDAFMSTAVGLFQTAQAQGFVADANQAARRRLEYTLSLPRHVRERQSDGSYGPGHPVN